MQAAEPWNNVPSFLVTSSAAQNQPQRRIHSQHAWADHIENDGRAALVVAGTVKQRGRTGDGQRAGDGDRFGTWGCEAEAVGDPVLTCCSSNSAQCSVTLHGRGLRGGRGPARPRSR